VDKISKFRTFDSATSRGCPTTNGKVHRVGISCKSDVIDTIDGKVTLVEAFVRGFTRYGYVSMWAKIGSRTLYVLPFQVGLISRIRAIISP